MNPFDMSFLEPILHFSTFFPISIHLYFSHYLNVLTIHFSALQLTLAYQAGKKVPILIHSWCWSILAKPLEKQFWNIFLKPP